MLKTILLSLGLMFCCYGSAQNCKQDLKLILSEGEHLFKEIHFKHKGKETRRGFLENLSYVDHQGRIHGVVPDTVYNVMVNNEINFKKKTGATDMVISETGTQYKVIFSGEVVKFIPSEENSRLKPFAINCNTNMLILGKEKIELERKKVVVEYPDNIFKSQWEGYLWTPAEKNSEHVLSYNFTIAKIRNNGKTYIEIKTPDDRSYRLLSS
ncbi:hypothetical protein LS482_17705 [Sinomicrobium kalidii]|uniref:hypothetical protein n=1 Tax=Sinomicrobium kalidii TaxID=2900738 RepID=UPI001E57519E|nr:hypothetical protein [Sinomicrobium kalidii]UGU15504.1 hypothetical protein LS482_17705 [Sinomicrobium kalidii]